MSYMTEIDGELFNALELWFQSMSTDEFKRVYTTTPDGLLMEAYLRIAEKGVNVSEVDPENLKKTIAWFKQTGYCLRRMCDD